MIAAVHRAINHINWQLASYMDKEGKLKVYCETSFWSYLNGGRTALQHIAIKQAATLQWWEEIAPACDVFISPFVDDEAENGDAELSALRLKSMEGVPSLDGSLPEITALAEKLIKAHAVPDGETVDASHIATAAVYGMDVLLTWNCKHMANPVTLPKTASVISMSGFPCPAIMTPAEFIERREELGL